MQEISTFRLVALIPQECCYDDDGEPFRHSGFRIEFIPYAGTFIQLSYLFLISFIIIIPSSRYQKTGCAGTHATNRN